MPDMKYYNNDQELVTFEPSTEELTGYIVKCNGTVEVYPPEKGSMALGRLIYFGYGTLPCAKCGGYVGRNSYAGHLCADCYEKAQAERYDKAFVRQPFADDNGVEVGGDLYFDEDELIEHFVFGNEATLRERIAEIGLEEAFKELVAQYRWYVAVPMEFKSPDTYLDRDELSELLFADKGDGDDGPDFNLTPDEKEKVDSLLGRACDILKKAMPTNWRIGSSKFRCNHFSLQEMFMDAWKSNEAYFAKRNTES